MAKIFILGKNKQFNELGDFIEVQNLKLDSEIHDWIIEIFDGINEEDKIAIEISDNFEMQLKLAFHIRLSHNKLFRKALIPILFISSSDLETIILKTKIWSHIFSTKGVYFIQFKNNSEVIHIELTAIEGLKHDDYKTQFLDCIKILPDAKVGRHSIANIWGAYVLDKAANTIVLNENEEFKKLYFKYISALSHIDNLKPTTIKTNGFIKVGESKCIYAKGKKILLIDDEANKGWETVLRKVFKTTLNEDFCVHQEKTKDYNGLSEVIKEMILKNYFDLYLVDLRLNGIEEDNIHETKEFSGMKVLIEIKRINKGNQVIMFTASNKVWNLKELLDAGADGYYMKESPEYTFTYEHSKQNYELFKENVEMCFERGYLKDMFTDIQHIKYHLNSLEDNKLRNELVSQIDLFWFMIIKANSKNDFGFSYVSLYMVLEIINKYHYEQTNDNKWEIKDTGYLLNWKWNEERNKYENENNHLTSNNPPEWQKLVGLYFQYCNGTNHEFVRDLYHLILKRNGFVHKEKKILDRRDKQRNFIYKDVYKKEGCCKLFDAVKEIIYLL